MFTSGQHIVKAIAQLGPFITIVSSTLFGSSVEAAQSPAALVIEAAGFADNAGHAIAKLFAPEDNVRTRGRLEVAVTIQNGQAVLVFSALPPGDYAVVIFHDANDNGTIDHNVLGWPNEALGFSNNFTLSVMSGLPSFKKLRFTHADVTQKLVIKVR
jgi:uncharacterized protein (DUF2141 family)